MKKLALIAGLLLLSTPAHAELAEVYGQLHLGGGFGKGVSGDLKDDDFFRRSRGGSYGLLAGVELLGFDGFIEHDQFFDGDGIAGTWTQIMLGMDLNLELTSVFVEFGGAAGIGFGTGQQVDPPLDNTEISDKGFVAQFWGTCGYKFNRFLSVGVQVPVSYAYLIKNDTGTVMDLGTRYHSVHTMIYGFVRVTLGI